MVIASSGAISCSGATEPKANPAAKPLTVPDPALVRSYPVDRTVAEFSTNRDLSTPEAAYAFFNHLWSTGDQEVWWDLSIASIAQHKPESSPKNREVSRKAAQEYLEARILEVWIYRTNFAMAFARVPHPSKTLIDIRNFQLENGRWLNAGNDVVNSVAEARKLFNRRCAYRDAQANRSSRPPVAHPDEFLRPFVEFLRREASDPQAFLLQALAERRLTVLGEVHHRPRYWAFNAALVKSPAFARQAGVIYLELPSNDQPLVERFLAAPEYDPQPIIEMLRDNLWMGWPDQPMLDFFKTVWQVNQPLPKPGRLRIVLVDMARPWTEIKRREDWRKYEVDRDQLMASNVVRDLRLHAADPRHALFIVGYMHAPVELSRPGGDPLKSAGWHLREELARTNLLVVFPHSPVISNMGEVGGRIALGLFESAFAALTNRPLAFPLARGPFGEQVFDASLDVLSIDPFRQGYDAYLYLGPVEDESFSSLIPGFYTDDFVKELDRRSRVMFGQGLVKAHGIKTADPEGVIQWLSRTWGQPRHDWAARRLGPLNAWELGSDWEKQAAAAKLRDWKRDRAAIRQAAVALFEAIRKADYEHPGDWRDFPARDVDYRVYTDAPAWMNWICSRFRTNPIVALDLGDVRPAADGRPAVPYQATLQDGAKLEGVLPLEWDARGGTWFGVEGLDWHLKPATESGRRS